MPTYIFEREANELSKLTKAGICVGYLAVVAMVIGLAVYDVRIGIWISDAASAEFALQDIAVANDEMLTASVHK